MGAIKPTAVTDALRVAAWLHENSEPARELEQVLVPGSPEVSATGTFGRG